MKGPDPRKEAAPLEEVPRLLREGAAEWNAAKFWHAHEAWESAWHALRAAQRDAQAQYVRGMILCAAALENATRDKEEGFKRQFAEGIFSLKTGEAPAQLKAARSWEEALVLLYADACRRREWSWWNKSGWKAPSVDLE